MRHASSVGPVIISIFLASALAAGCSCSTPRVQHRDTGTIQPPDEDAAIVTVDGQVVRPDAWFPDTGPPMDTGCGATTPVMNEIIGDPPDMLIVLDVSGSMCSPPGLGFGMTKLAIMKTALTNLVNTWDSRINLGLMEFPEVMSSSMAAACANGILRVPIAPHNAAALNARITMYPGGMFACATFCTGATPTPGAMIAARDYYATIPVNPIGRYVLLATDGEPNCGPVDDAGNSAPTVDETVAAIAALHGDGVTTYVLGFGNAFGSDPTALNRMAVAGGTGMAYNARDAAELDMALTTIAASIIPPSCTVMLDGGTRDPRLFQVSFDGGPLIPRDQSHASGWDYDAATNTITFYGNECDQVSGGHVMNIGIEFGCPGPLI